MSNLTVSDLMKTNLRVVHEDDSIRAADWEMTLDEIRHLLVVDVAGKLLGIVSDRDVLRARERGDSDVAISTIMNRDVLFVGPATPASWAVERMLRGKYSALPVVDEAGKPVGIVTSTDFLEIAYRALNGLDTRHIARA
ncbi:MAG: CBS domain-containing protein [Deltaproteobacteria bacterium]|nr:CBS domain-containing protein [Deltaproteobacteria bacterium]